MRDPVIIAEAVTFGYPGGASVLNNASFGIPRGGYVLVRGPSGAGKSTLLRLLCRLEDPQGGRFLLEGDPFDVIPYTQLRQRIAMVLQTPALGAGSVAEVLRLAYSFRANAHLSPPSDEELRAQLDDFRLTEVPLSQEAAGLSVGQAQRVALVRTLLLGPKVLLLDEPTSALDSESASVVLSKVRELNGQGITVIMISHSEAVPEGVSGVLRLEGGKAVLS